MQSNPNVEYIHVDARPDEAIVMSSLCPKCEEQGETRMLLTEIPFFKEIVIMSFSCPHCNYKNNELQPASTLEDFGSKITLNVTNKEDLGRDIVRSKHATISVPELNLEIPCSGKGYFSTLEGFLTTFKEDLEMDQEDRKINHPEVHQQIEDFIRKLEKYIECREDILPFTFIMDDPSGHSNIKNPFAPKEDPNLKLEKYVRTVEQIVAMGYTPDNVDAHNLDMPIEDTQKKESLDKAKSGDKAKYNYTENDIEKLIGNLENKQKLGENPEKKEVNFDAAGMDFNKPFDENLEIQKDLKKESLSFETQCHNCGKEGVTRMCVCEIPFFKEIIVMAFTCDKCGARSSDVKTGGGISDFGKKMTFKVNGEDDMNRDLFKSETAEVEIKELGLTITEGSLGAFYSTVEGLFMKMVETLQGNNPFVGDSADVAFKSKFSGFIDELKRFQDGKQPFT